jgi:DNA-binding transcriptional LysR family regulator
MDPRHLVQLATILDQGSMSQASRFLHLTQPTLTHNMQTLEMQAGGLLFERSRLGVRSTPLGEMLAREGRDIGRRLKIAQEASARHRQGLSQQLRIGAGALIGAVLLPVLTRELLASHPDLAVTLQGERPHLLVEQLLDGQHDLVIGPSWQERPPAGVERGLLVDDELGVFCASSHPLAKQTQLPFGAADNQRWISLGLDTPFTRDVAEMLAEVGVNEARNEVAVSGEAMMLFRILAEGQHLAVLPRFPARALGPWFPMVELQLATSRRPRKLYLWCKTSLAEAPTFIAVKAALHQAVKTVAQAL